MLLACVETQNHVKAALLFHRPIKILYLFLLFQWLWNVFSVSPDFHLPFLVQNRNKNVNDFCKYNWCEITVSETSLVAQEMKNLPAMQEIQVQSLCWEESLEKRIATHSRILAWRIPWTEGPGRLQSIVSWRAGHDWSDLAHMHRVSVQVWE